MNAFIMHENTKFRFQAREMAALSVKPDNLSVIPGTLTVKEQKAFLQAIL